MLKHKEEKVRHFGGLLRVVIRKGHEEEDRQQRNLEKKHLKAYLRGDKDFYFGKGLDGNPMLYHVQENWF